MTNKYIETTKEDKTMEKTNNEIKHAVVYAYNYSAYTMFFDTAEAAKAKVADMLSPFKPQLWKIHFCESISATQSEIKELQDRVQDILYLLDKLHYKAY